MDTQQTQFKDLNEVLAKHNANSEKREGVNISLTHTRIPDRALGIYGGSYIIPKEMEPTFWHLYYGAVFTNRKLEYLTEKQLETECPILLDFDFRYNYDVETRQHTKEHIIDIINLTMEVWKNNFFKNGTFIADAIA